MQQFALPTNLMTKCQLTATDNLQSEPSLGLGVIAQKNKSIAVWVGTQDRENFIGC